MVFVSWLVNGYHSNNNPFSGSPYNLYGITVFFWIFHNLNPYAKIPLQWHRTFSWNDMCMNIKYSCNFHANGFLAPFSSEFHSSCCYIFYISQKPIEIPFLLVTNCHLCLSIDIYFSISIIHLIYLVKTNITFQFNAYKKFNECYWERRVCSVFVNYEMFLWCISYDIQQNQFQLRYFSKHFELAH